jgi:hypothetical protein
MPQWQAQASGDFLRPEGLHPDAYLTNYSLSYMPSRSRYVADQVFPRVRVDFENDMYIVWDAATDYAVDTAAPVRPGSMTTELRPVKNDAHYKAEGYGKHVKIPDRERKQAKGTMNIETKKTRRLAHQIIAMREVRCATIATAAVPGGNTYDLSSGSATQWDEGSSHPFIDILTAMRGVKSSVGVVPNRILIPWNIAAVLSQHPDFVDRVKYTQATSSRDVTLPDQILGAKVIIAGADYNVAAIGGQAKVPGEMSLSHIWGNNVLLFYVEDDQTEQVDDETLSSFKSFWVPDSGGVYTWYNNETHSTIVEQIEVIAEVVPAADTTALLENVLAAA